MIGKTVKRRLKKFLLWMEIVFILVLGAGAGGVLAVWYQINKVLPPDAALDSYRPPVGSKIYSSDGQLLAKLAVENREPIPLDKMPKDMQNAMVAIEDSRFYTHGGLDFWGIGRALVTNISGREMSQGASTITQQLARNMFLSSRKKISRKLKEVLIAVQIERNWTKRQILEAYLNQVYFGAGAYGVKSAAQTYFSKDPGSLTLAECAMLAGMPQRPSELNPYVAFDQDGDYKRTKARRDDVLQRMLTLKMIDQARYDKAVNSPIKVAKQRPATIGYFKAKYYVQHVVDQLREEMGYDQEILDKTGLTIITSLNWKMQQAAEKAMKKGIGRYRGWGRVSDGALICIDPNTGYIRAMVGGVNEPWEKHQFNCATQARRQPGSSFKMFVYANALESGRSPYSSVGANAAIKMPDGKMYTPNNHGRARGHMSLVSAFAGSVNGAAVNLAVEQGIFEGPKKVADLAHRMGIRSDLMAVPALALGTSEVTPLELANAYGAIASGGRAVAPMVILQVRSQEGEIVKDFAPKVTNLGLKASTVEGVNMMTRAVVTGGTGTGASSVANAHGKTGTTEKNTDAWFAGYVPNELVTVVWAGNRNNKPMSHSLYGGTICAPIWAEFMQQAIKLNPDKKPVPKQVVAEKRNEERRRRRARVDSAPISPDETAGNRIRLNVCAQTGLLAGGDCPATSREFLLGDQPMDRCGGNHKKPEPEKPVTTTPPPVDEPGKPEDPPGDNQ